jgi:hypothetical protein
MAQADSYSTTRRPLLRSPETHLGADPVTSATPPPAPAELVVSDPQAADPILGAMEAHKRELDRRNQTIEAICAAEERHKAEERDAWQRYENASIALLTTKPTTMAGIIALMKYLAMPECSGEGRCETVLDGARLSSNWETAAAAERFPALSAEVLQAMTGQR